MAVQLSTWSPHWYEAKEAFLAEIGNSHTQAYYRSHLMRFLEDVVSPELVTTEHVNAFIKGECVDGKRNAGLPAKPSTRNTRAAIVSSFYSYCANYRIIGEDGKPTRLFQDVNPIANYKRAVSSPPERGMSEDEISRFFLAIDKVPDVSPLMRARDKALFYFMLASCRRVGEVLSLRVRDFQYETIKDENEQKHDAWVYHFIPSKKQVRKPDMMEIAPSVMAVIQAYWKARSVVLPDLPAFARIGAPGCEDVHTRDPYQPMSSDAVARAMKKYLLYAGMDETLSPHVWRHSGAQWRYRNGSDVVEISHVLRHSSLAITSTYLAKLKTPVDHGVSRFEAKFAHLAQ